MTTAVSLLDVESPGWHKAKVHHHAAPPWRQFFQEVLKNDLPELRAFFINVLIALVSLVVLAVVVAVLAYMELTGWAVLTLMAGVAGTGFGIVWRVLS